MNPTLNPTFNASSMAATGAAALTAATSTAGTTEAPTEKTGMAEFHQRTGPLLQMRQPRAPARPSRPSPSPKRQGVGSKSAAKLENEMEDAVVEALEHLQQGGGDLEDWLAGSYDVLARHSLLREALSRSTGEDEQVLAGLLEKLELEHGSEIKTGLAQRDDFESVLAEMDAMSATARGYDPDAISRFRALFKGGAGETPIEAEALATMLAERFGTELFKQGLANIRKKMADAARGKNPATVGPRMWLTLTDAANFNLIQSCFGIGHELHTNLSQAGVNPRRSDADIAVTLLGVANPRNGHPSKLAQNIVGDLPRDETQAAKMYGQIARTVEQLPLTLWPLDKMSQRADLLQGLRARSGLGGGRLTALQERDSERREQDLRVRLGQAPSAAGL